MLPTSYSISVKVIAFIALCVALVLGTAYLVDDYNDAKYSEKENRELIQVNKKLSEKTKEVLEKQAQISNLQTQLEGYNVRENERVNEVLSHYISLINDGFRLRDMGKNTRGLSKGGGTTNSTSDTSNGGNLQTCSNELSREATEFLLEFATDADKVVTQLEVCQVYSNEIRRILTKISE